MVDFPDQAAVSFEYINSRLLFLCVDEVVSQQIFVALACPDLPQKRTVVGLQWYIQRIGEIAQADIRFRIILFYIKKIGFSPSYQMGAAGCIVVSAVSSPLSGCAAESFFVPEQPVARKKVKIEEVMFSCCSLL